jgi:phospholipid/cholesterol/gamma-HCH transport system permease protein
LVSDLSSSGPDLSSETVPTAVPTASAAIDLQGPQEIVLSGSWTARGIGNLEEKLQVLVIPRDSQPVVDGSRVDALDTAGVWLLQRLLERLRAQGAEPALRGWRPQFTKLLELIAQHSNLPAPARVPRHSVFERVGRGAAEAAEQTYALLSFIGETAVALAATIAHPARLRLRPILHNIQSAGFSALPIVGVLSFLLGVVVAYQGADQLKRYGANIFVADLVGLSMLREFAPLITAIIVAGRSGSAYAAQIGTMAVTEEIDALRTIGIPPLDLLVLPKIVALIIVLPLLTVYADVLGVFGGMIMARSQLGVGFEEFLDRFVNAVDLSTYLVGVGKAPVFAIIIAVIGCFQGFRTHGGADSVGRQTTRSVVQAIFLVIVADALFSIAFSVLDI